MTSPVQHAPFPPVRPYILKDEWQETYLGRVSRANGVRLPRIDHLDRLRHLPPAKDTRFCADPHSAVRQEYLSDLPEWAVQKQGAPIRYCPACFHESNYVRARWRLRAYEVCTIHGLRLKHGLTDPALTTLYNSPGKHRIDEITEAQIWEGATCPMPRDRDHAMALWTACDQSIADADLPGWRDTLGWALLAEHLVDSIVTSGYGPDYPLRGASRLSHRSHWLTSIGLRITASKEGVLDFLLSIASHSDRRIAASSLLSLIRKEQKQTTLLSRLPLQYLLDRLVCFAPDALCSTSYGALPAAMHPQGYISVDLASMVIGCQLALLHYLLRAEFFVKVHKVRFGRKLYVFIDKTEVEACRRWMASCLSPEEVKQSLCVDKPGYWALLDCKLLRPIQLGSWTKHRREDLTAIISRLDNVAYPYPSGGNQLQPLMGAWLRKKGRPRAVVTSVLDEIWCGKIPVYRKLGEPGLQAYYVDARAVLRSQQLSAFYRANHVRELAGPAQLSLLET